MNACSGAFILSSPLIASVFFTFFDVVRLYCLPKAYRPRWEGYGARRMFACVPFGTVLRIADITFRTMSYA